MPGVERLTALEAGTLPALTVTVPPPATTVGGAESEEGCRAPAREGVVRLVDSCHRGHRLDLAATVLNNHDVPTITG